MFDADVLANIGFIFYDLLLQTHQVLLRVQTVVTTVCVVIWEAFGTGMGLTHVLFGQTANVAMTDSVVDGLVPREVV